MPKPARTVEVRNLAGVAEVCRHAGGVPRSTLARWRKTMDFPRPLKRLKGGEVWDMAHVRAWHACRALNAEPGVVATIVEPGELEVSENDVSLGRFRVDTRGQLRRVR